MTDGDIDQPAVLTSAVLHGVIHFPTDDKYEPVVELDDHGRHVLEHYSMSPAFDIEDGDRVEVHFTAEHGFIIAYDVLPEGYKAATLNA